jgi:Bacterial protein of unknown function (DUF899)
MTKNQHVVSRIERTTKPKERKTMTGTREEWLAARLELFEAEKELTRRSGELVRGRQELPWPQSGVMTGALVDYDQCVAGAYPE